MTEEMMCVPKIYVPISTCMLRVINNDTNEEIPRVFQKVAPHVYKKNKVDLILLGAYTCIIIHAIYYLFSSAEKCPYSESDLRHIVIVV